jgi:hypothetical protein
MLKPTRGDGNPVPHNNFVNIEVKQSSTRQYNEQK